MYQNANIFCEATKTYLIYCNCIVIISSQHVINHYIDILLQNLEDYSMWENL